MLKGSYFLGRATGSIFMEFPILKDQRLTINIFYFCCSVTAIAFYTKGITGKKRIEEIGTNLKVPIKDKI
jgi:hypothetical protein